MGGGWWWSADGASTLASGAGAATGPPSALLRAIAEGDDEALLLLAIGAVDTFGGMDGMAGGERYFLYRVMRALDLSNVLVAIMRQLRAEGVDGLELTMRRDHARQRLEQYRRLLAAEIRRRLSADDGRPGSGLVAPRRIEDLDVLGATTTELRQLRAAVRPLARKLASRLGQQRRRHRRGRLDVRRTLRRSLDAGGTPLDPAFRQRRTSKPRLVVLCDLSGSVAEFAHFTLALLQALRSELDRPPGVRLRRRRRRGDCGMQRAEVALDPRLLVTLPGVVARDGHSDYDGALAAFVERHADALGPGTTLLVAGDGRTNYRPSGRRPAGRDQAALPAGVLVQPRARRRMGRGRLRPRRVPPVVRRRLRGPQPGPTGRRGRGDHLTVRDPNIWARSFPSRPSGRASFQQSANKRTQILLTRLAALAALTPTLHHRPHDQDEDGARLRRLRHSAPEVVGAVLRVRGLEHARRGAGGGRAGGWTGGRRATPLAELRLLHDIDALLAQPHPTGIGELDRVLGGGLVAGSVTLLGGEPGIGKSTLLLQLLAWWPGPTLYVTAEESPQQVRLRAERLGAVRPELWLAAETSLPGLLAPSIGRSRSSSSSTASRPSPTRTSRRRPARSRRSAPAPSSSSSRPSGEACDRPRRPRHEGRRAGRPAGPRARRRHGAVLRGRAAPRPPPAAGGQAPLRVDRRARPVRDDGTGPHRGPRSVQLFLADRRSAVPGSVVVPAMEGRRPLLVEVQALTVSIPPGTPARRNAQGIDSGRLALLLAVLERRAGIRVSDQDVYASSRRRRAAVRARHGPAAGDGRGQRRDRRPAPGRRRGHRRDRPRG